MIPRRALAVCFMAIALAFAFVADAAPKPTPAPKKKPPAKTAPKALPAKPKAVVPPPPDPELAKFSTINSLGMRFVQAGGVEFCIWPVRVRDYAAYSQATGGEPDEPWRKPGFAQTPEHPVVCVSWRDAGKFCEWLTAKEHAEHRLPADREYRLPSDGEWSRAVGLPQEKGASPSERDLGVLDAYPWGKQWPPPEGAGNFAGEETGELAAIVGYRDGFTNTAPVGSFAANAGGLFDMAGNVWQWCRDPWMQGSRERTLRGSSWFNGAISLSLLSSVRIKAAPDSVSDTYGFRIVIAPLGKL